MIWLRKSSCLLAFAVWLCSGSVAAQSVVIPAGTPVYAEMDQEVVSKKRKFNVGDVVRAHAWRDVTVDGRLAIRAGAPLVVRIARLKTAKAAGIKGDLELEAVSVRAVDGTDILLDGGYDKSGQGRKALSISLFAVVAWPLIFIKGKQAEMKAGTVFDCMVQSDAWVTVEQGAIPRIRLNNSRALNADILYERFDEDSKNPKLPIQLTLCGSPIGDAAIVSVNGREVKPIPLTLGEKSVDDDCQTVVGEVLMQDIAKNFQRGINRFEVQAGDQRVEILLDVEL